MIILHNFIQAVELNLLEFDNGKKIIHKLQWNIQLKIFQLPKIKLQPFQALKLLRPHLSTRELVRLLAQELKKLPYIDSFSLMVSSQCHP